MWIIPSMPSPKSTNAPNFARLVTGRFDRRAHRIFLQRFFPGIAQRLLQPQRDALVGRIDAQHHHLDHVARLHDIRRAHILLGPRHFGNVDQAFDAGFQFDERAEIGHPRNFAVDARARLILSAPPASTDRATVASAPAKSCASRD